MHIFARSHWTQFSEWASRRNGKSGRRPVVRKSKEINKRIGVLDELEQRQTISDTFFTGMQLAGASIMGALSERSRDPFGATNLVDLSVSGGSSEAGRIEMVRSGWQGAAPPAESCENSQ